MRKTDPVHEADQISRRASRRATEHGETRRRRGRAPERTDPIAVAEEAADAARRRIPWTWWALAAVVVLVTLAALVLRAPFFAVNHVQLNGESRTSEGAVLEALQIIEGESLARFNTNEAADRVGELPWVESVSVNRGWPSTLQVTLRERTPAAALAVDGGATWVVVDATGHVLEHRLTPPTTLPLVHVPREIGVSVPVGGVIDAAKPVLDVATSTPAQLTAWVDTWTMTADGEIFVELVGSARAVLGSERDHRTQFVSLASIVDGGTSLVCISSIDLRVPDTPVIERDADCLAASGDQ
ncbi:MAG: FtsQ-type POTRA domain-containing protein [Acidimicrobiales bacterium]|nr:FtsQ-type POTRA domain-containing protein [Acidimicrobiales bacterium]RZV45040.1 MAG: FtsQ-type POTRA domain-containing protein [Acidimicrobiales bacterium]